MGATGGGGGGCTFPAFFFWKLQLVAKIVETLLTFEANFRHLAYYNVYPAYLPLISVVRIGDQIENLGEQHWKRGGGSQCQWTVSFVNRDMFFMKKSFFLTAIPVTPHLFFRLVFSMMGKNRPIHIDIGSCFGGFNVFFNSNRKFLIEQKRCVEWNHIHVIMWGPFPTPPVPNHDSTYRNVNLRQCLVMSGHFPLLLAYCNPIRFLLILWYKSLFFVFLRK